MESTHELAHHIQNLPPELADQIFELALAWDKDAHTIDEFYEPPTLLHIDRTSRQKYAYPFFNATFQVDNTPLLLRWLKSLPAEHLSLIKALRHKPSSSLLGALVANLPAQFHVIKGKARMQLASINATVANAGYHFADSVLHLLFYFQVTDNCTILICQFRVSQFF